MNGNLPEVYRTDPDLYVMDKLERASEGWNEYDKSLKKRARTKSGKMIVTGLLMIFSKLRMIMHKMGIMQ